MDNQQENKNEIDLSQLSTKIKGYFGRVNDSFFDTILFLKRNIIVVIILIASGVILGYFKDKASHSYSQQFYAIPNFGSTDYLYTEIERLNSKVKAGDTVFLKQLGIKNTKRISKIEIEPVADLYNFIENPTLDENENLRYQVLKLVSESGEGKTLIEDPVTGKNFKVHLVTIRTNQKTTEEELINPIVKHLNDNPYYRQLQQPYVENLKNTIVANDSTLKQIDGILNEYAKGGKASTNVIFSGEAGIGDVIKLKNKLLKEQEQNRVNLINYTDVIKNASSITNTSLVNITSNKMKVIYPILFLLIFAAIAKFIKYYKTQSAKRKSA
jgi:predicted RNase H-related nuclease YkuK (DUF458 family)